MLLIHLLVCYCIISAVLVLLEKETNKYPTSWILSISDWSLFFSHFAVVLCLLR